LASEWFENARSAVDGEGGAPEQVWDAETGEELLNLPDGAGRLAFSPDGRMLASNSDLAVRVWAIEIEELMRLARQRLTRSFTAEECREFLQKETCPT
jgi:WD40 repeat protein